MTRPVSYHFCIACHTVSYSQEVNQVSISLLTTYTQAGWFSNVSQQNLKKYGKYIPLNTGNET